MAFAIYENENSKITWIDVTSPTSSELSELSKKYSLNHFAISDCLEPDHLPKHEDIDGTHFIMTRSLLPTRNGQSISIQSISTKIAFFYRDGLLVTIHRIPHDFIVDVRKRHFDEDNFHSVEEIVAKLLWYVLHSYEIPAVRLSTELDDFENKVFSQNITPQILSELYQIKRNALMSKKLLLFSQEAVSSVKIKNNDTGALQDTRDLHLKLLNIYDQIHEDVSNLVNFYLSISAQKTNEVIKVLTVFSVFFMPLTFIAGIYGMNFEYMPELKVRWGYPILLIIMILLSGLIYLWFKKEKMALNHRIRIYEQSCVIFLKVLFDNSYFCKKLIMNIKERQRKIMTAGAEKITKWIGSTKSVILHTLFFVISFLLPNIGWVEFDRMLLILTTVVSLEAIYLSIFIQISLNLNSESIEIIQEDIQEIGEDLEELSDDIEELSEDIEEIGDDITKKTDRELLISIQKSMVILKREITILKKSNPKS